MTENQHVIGKDQSTVWVDFRQKIKLAVARNTWEGGGGHSSQFNQPKNQGLPCRESMELLHPPPDREQRLKMLSPIAVGRVPPPIKYEKPSSVLVSACGHAAL